MKLYYVGNRANKVRLAEMSYDKDTEMDRFLRITSCLRTEYNWNIDDGVAGWAAVRVMDRCEFNEFKRDFNEVKKMFK